MAEQIKAIIGADISELKAGVFKAEQELLRLKQSRAANIKVGLDTTKLDSQISSLESKLASLNKTASPTVTTISKVGTVAQTAAGQMSQMDGAAGDVANSVGDVSSAIGSGGLSVALTAAVAVLKLSYDWFEKNRIAAGAMAKMVSDANAEAIKNSGEEIATVKALTAVASDLTKSMDERLKAVRYLKQEWPETYANMTDEKILLGQTKEATDALTASLLSKAKAQVYASKIADNEAQIDLLKAEGRALLKNNDLLTKASNFFGYRSPSIDALVEKIDNLVNANKVLEAEFKKNVTSGFVPDKPKPTKAAPKPKEIFNTPQVSGVKSLLETTGLVAKPIDFTPLIDSAKDVIPQVKLSFTELEASWLQTVDNIGSIMETAVESGIFNIGDAIGTALVNGDNVLQAAGGSLLQTLGGFISSIAQQMIEFGVLTAAFGAAKEALSKAGVSGVVAIAAGVALAGIGAAISASGKKVSSAASGGKPSSSGGSSTNYGNSSSSYSGGGYGGGGTVVFEIAGSKLIGVLNNTLDANRRLGGNIRS